MHIFIYKVLAALNTRNISWLAVAKQRTQLFTFQANQLSEIFIFNFLKFSRLFLHKGIFLPFYYAISNIRINLLLTTIVKHSIRPKMPIILHFIIFRPIITVQTPTINRLLVSANFHKIPIDFFGGEYPNENFRISVFPLQRFIHVVKEAVERKKCVLLSKTSKK